MTDFPYTLVNIVRLLEKLDVSRFRVMVTCDPLPIQVQGSFDIVKFTESNLHIWVIKV